MAEPSARFETTRSQPAAGVAHPVVGKASIEATFYDMVATPKSWLIGPDAKVLDLVVRVTGSGYQRLFSTAMSRILPY